MWWGLGDTVNLNGHITKTQQLVLIYSLRPLHNQSVSDRIIVLMAGHYPWQSILEQQLESLKSAYPHIDFWGGTEISICESEVKIDGDHAGKEETSYGLAMFPEFVGYLPYEMVETKPCGQKI